MADRRSSYVLTARRRAAGLVNLRQAWAANRQRFRLTPARRAASRANLLKAQEVSRQGYRPSPRRRAAGLANLRLAWAANEQGFRLTAARRAASRANIRIAQATQRSPESYARSRFNHLKHGFTGRTLEETFTRLGEDPNEFEEYWHLLARAFAPQDEIEAKLLRRLAEAVWRRLRFFRAQARWEGDSLKSNLLRLPASKKLSVEQTRTLAYGVFASFLNQEQLYGYEWKLLGKIERLLRILLRKRGGGDPEFKVITRQSRRELRELDEEEMEDRALARLAEGGPEVERILESIVPERWRKRPGSGRES
jgi:hypothetical protein